MTCLVARRLASFFVLISIGKDCLLATKSPHEEPLNGSPIADTSIKQPVLITMIMTLILVAGFIAYRGLPVNLLPDFDLGIVNITVVYPGAGPDTVANEVAKPIED